MFSILIINGKLETPCIKTRLKTNKKIYLIKLRTAHNDDMPIFFGHRSVQLRDGALFMQKQKRFHEYVIEINRTKLIERQNVLRITLSYSCTRSFIKNINEMSRSIQ